MKTLCLFIILAALAKLGWESLIFRHLKKRAPKHALRKSALLLVRDLVVPTNLRYALGVIGGVLIPLMMLGPNSVVTVNTLFAALVFGCSFLSEMLERVLYFKAVVALKMPGGLSA
jgi:formate dehydrogenase iron-sulfur subunit